ncbi:peptide chain release factor N(5)-glutamine methyltransferase [Flavisolibacter sp. BT320]|nr:peptide chain release factor N(5)-glutamine methyltransferase [Flavisolibacter longurius]
MKIGEAKQMLQQALEKIYDSSESSNIAQLLLEENTGYSGSEMLLKKDEALLPEKEEKLHQQLQRLLTHEPLHYVLNKAWFYGMELYVDKAVLIPRPETEELVHWIVSDVKASGLPVFDKNPLQADATTQLKILDIGTGSGCIALALKKEIPKAEVWGCDVSEEALNVARRNGSALHIRVDFQGINFLDASQQASLPTVNIIVSNPPYIPLQDKATMQPNVVDFEPHTALFVPDNDALLFYKAIAAFAKKRLYPNGTIYLEIHEALGAAVVELFQSEGFASVELKKDMQGKERMVKVVSLE